MICQAPWVQPTALLSSCAESKALGCKTTKHRGLINGGSKMFPCALSALDRLGCRWPCCSQVLTVKQLLLLLLPGLLGYKSINTWLVVTVFFIAFATAVSFTNVLYLEESMSNRQKMWSGMLTVLSVGAFLLPLNPHHYHICPAKTVSRQMFIFCHWVGWGSERIRYGQILLLVQIMQIPKR